MTSSGFYLAALDDERFDRPAQRGRAGSGAKRRVREGARARAAPPGGRAGPGAALRMLFGDMAVIVTDSQNVRPKLALELGFSFAHADLDEALRNALSPLRSAARSAGRRYRRGSRQSR
jgi:hypothetical protein